MIYLRCKSPTICPFFYCLYGSYGHIVFLFTYSEIPSPTPTISSFPLNRRNLTSHSTYNTRPFLDPFQTIRPWCRLRFRVFVVVSDESFDVTNDTYLVSQTFLVPHVQLRPSVPPFSSVVQTMSSNKVIYRIMEFWWELFPVSKILNFFSGLWVFMCSH